MGERFLEVGRNPSHLLGVVGSPSSSTDTRESPWLRLVRTLRKENPNYIRVYGLDSSIGDSYKEFGLFSFI